MLERKAVIDPGSWSLKLYDTRSRKHYAIRTCLYQDDQGVITGTDALQAYWSKGKSRILYPMSQGRVMLDLRRLFQDLLSETQLSGRLLKPKATIILPQDVLLDEQMEWINLCTRAGFGKVSFVSTMDLLAVERGLVIHAGHSCTELAVYYDGQQIEYKKIIYGGAQIDENIIDAIARSYKALVFNEDAAVLRRHASDAFWENRNPRMECAVLDYTSQYMRLELPAMDMWPPMSQTIRQIVWWAKDLISRHGPDVAASVLENPIALSGGLAGCFGLSQMLEEQLGATTLCPSDPDLYLLEKAAGHTD